MYLALKLPKAHSELKGEFIFVLIFGVSCLNQGVLVDNHFHTLLTLIPTAVTIYGAHYFKAKYLNKSLNNKQLKIANP
jgi:hypothetical protein